MPEHTTKVTKLHQVTYIQHTLTYCESHNTSECQFHSLTEQSFGRFKQRVLSSNAVDHPMGQYKVPWDVPSKILLNL